MNNKLKEIEEEDFVWIIFIILFIFKLYSNAIENDYRINNNLSSRYIYHYINEFTYIVALIIYIYYIYINWNKNTKIISIITNGLSIIVLLIFIYLEVIDEY